MHLQHTYANTHDGDDLLDIRNFTGCPDPMSIFLVGIGFTLYLHIMTHPHTPCCPLLT